MVLQINIMQIFSLSKGSKDVNPIKTFFEEKTKEKYNTFHDFLIANEYPQIPVNNKKLLPSSILN